MFKKRLATFVILLFLGLAVSPSIYAERDKVSLEPVPDLDCSGELDFVDIEPGATVCGTITVENIGEDDSELSWEIESFPEWGTWTFDPESGTGLLAGDTMTIDVEIVIIEIPPEYTGEVVVVNSNDSSDFCTVPISCPINKNYISYIDYDGYNPIQLVFLLINKLRYYEGIEYVQSEEDVLDIIESDAELSGIVKELKSFDCGCEDEYSALELDFPLIICILLVPLLIFSWVAWWMGGVTWLGELVFGISSMLNCPWRF